MTCPNCGQPICACREGRKMIPYYQDSVATLYQGDALEVFASLPTGTIDAIITDPPYSSGGQYKGDRSGTTGSKYSSAEIVTLTDFSGDNRDQRSFHLWMNLWLSEALRGVAHQGTVCALFSDWRQLPTMTDALQVGGWVWRGIVPWAKPNGRPAWKQRAWLNQCEYVVWGTAGSSANTADGSTSPLPGFYHAPPPRDREHQTQKPVAVMRELVKIVPEGATILDPFMGAGTTGVAAVLEGRKFIGVEMVNHFCAIAERRIRESEGHAVGRDYQEALDFDGGAA